ncbi:MAG: hypothetical protein ACRC3Y_12430 [Romboutsia sp.]|uniref:hypothetical protein n=1 Tax=Romboutsia sp. TaxID=1965302 RepID=UPI003F408473
MKNKISALVAVGLISISGILVFADNNSSGNDYDPSLGGGCIDLSDPQVAIAPEQLDAMGKITSITHDGDNIIIRVEAVVDENLKDGIMTLDLKPEARYDIADVIINKDTLIQKGDSTDLLKPSDLKQGQMVEVNFVGPEGRTYPVKANGFSVTIIETYND